MEIYLAMDIKNGEVVWGCKGEREKYEPISLHSKILKTSKPLEVLKEIKPKKAYIADIDSIEGKKTNNTDAILKDIINKTETKIIVDRGFKSQEELVNLPYTPVLGSETYDLRYVIDNVFVSLDFLGGFLDASGVLDLKSAIEILNTFNLKVIVLDIGRVGTSQLNLDLLEKILSLSNNPVYAGGGVKGINDLKLLKEIGIEGAIVATAVHQGNIPLSIVQRGKF